MRILWPAKCRVVVKLDTGTDSRCLIKHIIQLFTDCSNLCSVLAALLNLFMFWAVILV